MAGETTLTIIGNAVADAELRFIQSGQAVASFTVVSSPRAFDKQSGEWRDGDPLFMRVTAWRAMAEHTAESIRKGTRVIVTGTLKQRSYETKEGEKRTVVELTAEDIGVSVKFHPADSRRVEREQRPASDPADDLWGSAPAKPSAWSDEPPF
jgi:single-strand DNA-binding protein